MAIKRKSQSKRNFDGRYFKITLGKWNKECKGEKSYQRRHWFFEREWWKIVILLTETKEEGEEIAFGRSDELDFEIVENDFSCSATFSNLPCHSDV